MTRLIQIKKGSVRRVGLVEELHVRPPDGCSSIYELAQIAIDAQKKLSAAQRHARGGKATYSTMNLSTRGVLCGKCFRRLTILRFPALD